MMETILFSSYSGAGHNSVNEDYLHYGIINDNCAIAILADGMGGLEYGDIAAKITATTIYDAAVADVHNASPEELLRMSLLKADDAIKQKCYELKCKMGAAVAVVLVLENKVYCTWQGNVRIYAMNGNRPRLITEDHSTTVDGHTFLTRCINGKGFRTPVPIRVIPFVEDGKLLLCTDGYYQSVDEFKLFYWDTILREKTEWEDDHSIVEIRRA
jgi:serine/threonine protein phosphatase PrpC